MKGQRSPRLRKRPADGGRKAKLIDLFLNNHLQNAIMFAQESIGLRKPDDIDEKLVKTSKRSFQNRRKNIDRR